MASKTRAWSQPALPSPKRMKVSKLTDTLLDYFVAQAEKVDVQIGGPHRNGSFYCVVNYSYDDELNQFEGRHYCPSSHDSDGGPLLLKHEISTFKYLRGWGAAMSVCNLDKDQDGTICSTILDADTIEGDTPLIAGMRALVQSQFGEVVEIPADVMLKLKLT